MCCVHGLSRPSLSSSASRANQGGGYGGEWNLYRLSINHSVRLPSLRELKFIVTAATTTTTFIIGSHSRIIGMPNDLPRRNAPGLPIVCLPVPSLQLHWRPPSPPGPRPASSVLAAPPADDGSTMENSVRRKQDLWFRRAMCSTVLDPLQAGQATLVRSWARS